MVLRCCCCCNCHWAAHQSSSSSSVGIKRHLNAFTSQEWFSTICWESSKLIRNVAPSFFVVVCLCPRAGSQTERIWVEQTANCLKFVLYKYQNNRRRYRTINYINGEFCLVPQQSMNIETNPNVILRCPTLGIGDTWRDLLPNCCCRCIPGHTVSGQPA